MVVERAKDGKVFQVALDQEMCDSLYSDLKMYFKGNIDIRVNLEAVE